MWSNKTLTWPCLLTGSSIKFFILLLKGKAIEHHFFSIKPRLQLHLYFFLRVSDRFSDSRLQSWDRAAAQMRVFAEWDVLFHSTQTEAAWTNWEDSFFHVVWTSGQFQETLFHTIFWGLRVFFLALFNQLPDYYCDWEWITSPNMPNPHCKNVETEGTHFLLRMWQRILYIERAYSLLASIKLHACACLQGKMGNVI